MIVSQQNEAFLLGQFRDFYTEVIKLKEFIKNQGGMMAQTEVIATAVSENGHSSGNGHDNVTGQLPRIDPTMLETLSGSEKITSLALRAGIDSPRDPSAEQTRLTRIVWKSLVELFRRNAVQILRAAGKPTDNYFEAQYVMAVFADDIFIHLD